MEVEMVLGEVGEEGEFVDDAIHSVLAERMGGHLHHATIHAPLRHGRQQRVQIGCLRSRADTRDPLVTDAGLDRPDESDLLPHRREGGLDEVGGRGLAVGAGDPDDGQAVIDRGMDQSRGCTEHRTGVRMDQDGQVRPTLLDQLCPCGVGEDGHRPGSQCSRGEAGAMRTGTRQPGIQVSGLHRPRVEADPGDGHLTNGCRRPQIGGNPGEERGSRLTRPQGVDHGWRPYLPFLPRTLRRTVGSASAAAGSTSNVSAGAVVPVGGTLRAWRA